MLVHSRTTSYIWHDAEFIVQHKQIFSLFGIVFVYYMNKHGCFCSWYLSGNYVRCELWINMLQHKNIVQLWCMLELSWFMNAFELSWSIIIFLIWSHTLSPKNTLSFQMYCVFLAHYHIFTFHFLKTLVRTVLFVAWRYRLSRCEERVNCVNTLI